MLDGQGLVNHIFALFGDYKQNWLGNKHLAIVVVAFVNAWQWMGYQFALINAGIKSIPNDYYEAAKIDGCTNTQAHRKITIPLLKETYKFCLVISLTGGIKAFTEMNIMTGGGPGRATYTLTYMMYSAAYKQNKYGYGLAAATIMVLECMVVMMVINFVFRDKKEADEENRARRKRNA
jgi:raffinose/stachyose/melibiose transport system permease protein